LENPYTSLSANVRCDLINWTVFYFSFFYVSTLFPVSDFVRGSKAS
jgi:hypothetical protein